MNLATELAQFGPSAQPAAVSAEGARAYCRRLAESHYENFTVVSWLFPRRLSQHLANVYAYCRWADDLADESDHGEQALALLDWWGNQLDAVYSGQASHPVFIALAETIQKFQLPKEPLADLLGAFRRDQMQTRYETLADLHTYCEKSANPVGRLVLHLGRSFSAENARLSDWICTGLQLANFWQDIERDFARGRIYIPQANCRRHGWNESRFQRGVFDDDFRQLLLSLVDHADSMLRAGEPLIARVGTDLRLPVKVFLSGGQEVLAAIRKSNYDVWTRRPVVGRLAKLRLLLTGLLTIRWYG
jgi:squalene synthase HpnC